jgi:hypothetical protein
LIFIGFFLFLGQWSGQENSRKVGWKKPRKRGEYEFFPNVEGCIYRGLGWFLMRGGAAMACILGKYGVFVRGLFADQVVLPIEGWGEQ